MIRWFGKQLILVWFIITLVIIWEYYALNYNLAFSILAKLKSQLPAFKTLNLSTEVGRPISYILGWAGFGFMLTTNLYILRKRFMFMQNWGRPAVWLDYHIFCGLIGPTLIIFHTDFKIRGLVAISFWSMMVVAVSGVLGRYLYMRVLMEGSSLRQEIEKWERAINNMISKTKWSGKPDDLQRLKQRALSHVGALQKEQSDGLGFLFQMVIMSVLGDIRLFFSYAGIGQTIHPLAPHVFAEYALSVRREVSLEPFKKLLGYWHTFHVPFTISMYITAVIHIVVVTVFGV